MCGHPVENHADSRIVQRVDEVTKIIRRTEARRRRVKTAHLIAPGAVKRIFGNRHQFDMRVSHALYVRGKFVRRFTVREIAPVIMFHERAEMHFIDIHGARHIRTVTRCDSRMPVCEPRIVMPTVIMVMPYDRCTVCPATGKYRIRISL